MPTSFVAAASHLLRPRPSVRQSIQVVRSAALARALPVVQFDGKTFLPLYLAFHSLGGAASFRAMYYAGARIDC